MFLGKRGCNIGIVDYKDAQLESCKLSLIWGKMRPAAWETVPQIALKNCSKEAVGEGGFGKEGVQCDQALIFQRFSASQEKLMSLRRDLVLGS